MVDTIWQSNLLCYEVRQHAALEQGRKREDEEEEEEEEEEEGGEGR